MLVVREHKLNVPRGALISLVIAGKTQVEDIVDGESTVRLIIEEIREDR